MKQQKTLKSSHRHGFLTFAKREINRQSRNGHISVANNYQSAYNSFVRFLLSIDKTDVTLKKLTPQLISDYEAWLCTDGLCRNTTSFYLRTLQSIYHKAVRQGLTDDRHPFSDTYRGVAKTIKRAIKPNEVCLLQSLDIHSALIRQGYTGRRLYKLHRQLELARDIFIFCFCARGLTFVDLAHMRKSNIADGMLTYVRRKTKQRMEVCVEPMMQEILLRHPSHTDYLLPILTKTKDPQAVFNQYRYALARYNNSLKQLGEMIGGLKLTSYVSRHSWASAAHQQHVPLSVISQSMGHDSEKTTEIYLKSLECNVINKTNHELLTNIFNIK